MPAPPVFQFTTIELRLDQRELSASARDAT